MQIRAGNGGICSGSRRLTCRSCLLYKASIDACFMGCLFHPARFQAWWFGCSAGWLLVASSVGLACCWPICSHCRRGRGGGFGDWGQVMSRAAVVAARAGVGGSGPIACRSSAGGFGCGGEGGWGRGGGAGNRPRPPASRIRSHSGIQDLAELRRWTKVHELVRSLLSAQVRPMS